MTNNKMIVKGNIWTGDPDLPIADYFYVEDGSILYVGKGDNVPSEYSEAETLDSWIQRFTYSFNSVFKIEYVSKSC